MKQLCGPETDSEDEGAVVTFHSYPDERRSSGRSVPIGPTDLARDGGRDYHHRWLQEVLLMTTTTTINWQRVVLGGLVAGLIINAVEFVLNGMILQKDWSEAMKAIGRPENVTVTQIAAFNATGFLIGIFAVWLYSAIRPRYGPGPQTAACAGAAVWTIGYLLPSIAPMVLHILPGRLMAGIVVGFGEVLVGAVAGAWLYKETTLTAAGTT